MFSWKNIEIENMKVVIIEIRQFKVWATIGIKLLALFLLK